MELVAGSYQLSSVTRIAIHRNMSWLNTYLPISLWHVGINPLILLSAGVSSRISTSPEVSPAPVWITHFCWVLFSYHWMHMKIRIYFAIREQNWKLSQILVVWSIPWIPSFKVEACNPIDTSVVFSLLLSCKNKFLFWKMFHYFMFVGLVKHYFFFSFPPMICICYWKVQGCLWTVIPWLLCVLKHKA